MTHSSNDPFIQSVWLGSRIWRWTPNRFNMIWYDMIWYDMTWYDMIRQDMYDMIITIILFLVFSIPIENWIYDCKRIILHKTFNSFCTSTHLLRFALYYYQIKLDYHTSASVVVYPSGWKMGSKLQITRQKYVYPNLLSPRGSTIVPTVWPR